MRCVGVPAEEFRIDLPPSPPRPLPRAILWLAASGGRAAPETSCLRISEEKLKRRHGEHTLLHMCSFVLSVVVIKLVVVTQQKERTRSHHLKCSEER
jgi:hypothetical protein